MASSSDKKLVRSRSGLRFVTLNETSKSPFVVDEPAWVTDDQCRACLACCGRFDFLNRKHHCRRCGQVFCAKCVASRRTLPRMSFVDPVRQCQKCIALSADEADFFKVHLKQLQTGSSFEVKAADDKSSAGRCRLSADHRCLVFKMSRNDQEIPPIKVRSIDSLECISSSVDLQGDTVTSELRIHFSRASVGGGAQSVHLSLPTSGGHAQARLWMTALRHAMELVEKTRM